MEKARLAELVTLVRGVSYKKEQASKNEKEGYTSILRANNINDGAFNFDELVFVPSDLVTSQQKISKNDIVITMSSGSKAHVGKVAIAKTDMDSAFGAFCAKIIPQKIAPKYLFYILRSSDFRHHIETSCKGTNINNIKQEYILNYELLVPSIPEQERIVSRIEELFSELDNGVETLKKVLDKVERYKYSVIDSVLPVEHRKSIGECIEDMGQGWSPKCERYNVVDDEGWAVIKTTAIQPCDFLFEENKALPISLSPREKHEIKVGDILITRAGPKSRCGICCMVKKTKKRLLNCDKVYRLRLNQSIVLPQYLEYVLNSPEFLKEIDLCKTGGNDSGLNLTQTRFLSIEIPVPTVEEQKYIVNEIESRRSVCQSIENTVNTALQQAEAMQQSILKKAFEGEL